jgi:glycosyltransferase involved in cell wall biosynthesis
MRIAYLHYLYGDDTALLHARQFAAAAAGLGHEIRMHAINLAPPPPAAAGAAGAVAGGGAVTAEPAAAAAAGSTGQPAVPDAPRRRPRGPLARRLRWAARQRLGRYLHEPKELLWNARYLHHELALLAAGPRPDVLLVRDHSLTASSVLVAARLGLPLVYEINAPAAELALYYDEHLHLPLAAAWLEGFKLRRADAAITVSTALREHLLVRHGLRGWAADKIAVVPNGADLAAFRPANQPSPLARRLLGDSAGETVIGFVGSFQKFHGIELLADMALRVAELRPRVRFLLVGDGPGALPARRRLSPLGARAVTTGAVPHAEVPGLVAALDVGVLPESSFYACPLKVIEWMAAGKAVVAPRHGPLREVLADGEEGVLFPPRDLEALVAAVLRLVDRPDLRRRLAAAAAARASASLSWTDNARGVVAVLDRARNRALATGRAQPDLSLLGPTG